MFVTPVTFAGAVVLMMTGVVVYHPAAVADQSLPHAPVSPVSQNRCIQPTPLASTTAFQRLTLSIPLPRPPPATSPSELIPQSFTTVLVPPLANRGRALTTAVLSVRVVALVVPVTTFTICADPAKPSRPPLRFGSHTSLLSSLLWSSAVASSPSSRASSWEPLASRTERTLTQFKSF